MAPPSCLAPRASTRIRQPGAPVTHVFLDTPLLLTRQPVARSQLIPTAESPCIKVCQLDLDDRCRGCGRTMDEIARWRDMTFAERVAVNHRVGFVSHEHA